MNRAMAIYIGGSCLMAAGVLDLNGVGAACVVAGSLAIVLAFVLSLDSRL